MRLVTWPGAEDSRDKSYLLMVLLTETFPHASSSCTGRVWGAERVLRPVEELSRERGQKESVQGLCGRERIPSPSLGAGVPEALHGASGVRKELGRT